MRNSLKYVNWKDRKTITADLKTIYSAPTEEAARIALAAFRVTQDAKHPTIDLLYKLFYLSLKNISRKWMLTIPNWPSALSHFAIEFEDRMHNKH